MKKKQADEWPEIVFSSSQPDQSLRISRAVRQGLLKKIAPKIYTSNLKDSPEDIIKRYRYHILARLYPNAVIGYRSALEGGVSKEGIVVLTYKYTRTIKLPGLIIHLVKGPGPDEEDTPFLEGMYIASQGRAYLENMRPSRRTDNIAKTLSLEDIENRLNRLIRIVGNEECNRLREQAKRVAQRLGMQKESGHLDKIIGALLGTQSDTFLKSEIGRLRSQGIAYDPERLELFATITAYLHNAELQYFPNLSTTKGAKINEAFFESYFSNYIEGTQFEIEEAEKIVFEHKILPNRFEDSHDVLSTYKIVSDDQGMRVVPQSSDQLFELLLNRHRILMQAREDKNPGQFKQVINRAGNTIFVKPEEVRGTIIKGFDFYQRLKPGIARALFIMFLIAEVHPFLDGNGRIARIFMNAELDRADQCRIIIPTVFREDYIITLRKLSRQYDPAPFTKMMQIAQRFTHSISFQEYGHALTQLKMRNAFLEPSEGKLIVDKASDSSRH